MTDANQPNPAKIVDYSSNSKTAKKTEGPERPVPAQVVKGEVIQRKKSVGKKFREQFAGDDARTVGQSLLFEVFIPASKNLLFDLLTEGAKRMLFGGVNPLRPGGAASIIGGNRTNYTSYSNNRQSNIVPAGSPASKEMSSQQRAMHDFSGVILSTRGEAEEIIEVLTNLIDEYSTATVNDFYHCIGQSPEFTAVKYGWKSLGQASVRQVREGWLLELPRPVVLE